MEVRVPLDLSELAILIQAMGEVMQDANPKTPDGVTMLANWQTLERKLRRHHEDLRNMPGGSLT